MSNIALTGATGEIGSLAARHLAEAGLVARLIVRDASRAPDLPGFDVVAIPGDGGAPLLRALAGIDTALMVSAYEGEERQALHEDFIDAAVQSGVRHLVYLSFVGAAEDATNVFARDHGATENYLRDCGLDVTVLRSNYYAETLPQFVHNGQLRGPSGDGGLAAVARDDVAAAVAAVLTEPGAHIAKVYELTGPHALTFHEVADLLTPVFGTTITYIDQSDEQARQQKSEYGAPSELLDAWLSAYVAIRDGTYARVTTDVEHLLGRPPTPVADALRQLQD